MTNPNNYFGLEQVNESLFVATNDTGFLDRDIVGWLKSKARLATNKRARICLHQSADELVHEMIIAVHKESYIPPQIHPDKVESFHLIEGQCDVVLFTPDGKVENVVKLNAATNSECSYFYRVGAGVPHVIRIDSEFVVFHEVAKGPVTANSNQIPKWLPHFESVEKAKRWLSSLS